VKSFAKASRNCWLVNFPTKPSSPQRFPRTWSIAALGPGLAIELYERDAARESLERMDPCGAGNIHTWLVPRRESEALFAQARSDNEPIVASDPQAITIHPSTTARER
jgi:hypothetical protein